MYYIGQKVIYLIDNKQYYIQDIDNINQEVAISIVDSNGLCWNNIWVDMKNIGRKNDAKN